VYYGEKYREIFARSHVKLELRETNGAVDNLRLLQDPKSGVDIGFVNGGVSKGNPPPGLLSIGLMYNNAFWIFYRSTETLDRLSQLKGRRIAVGPEGSGTRFSAEQVLGAGGITSATATFLPYGGTAAADALKDGKVDVAWVLGGTDAEGVKALLHTPNVRLMNIPMVEALVVGAEAEAAYLVLDTGKPGEDQNGCLDLGDAQRPENLEARHVRQVQVEQDDVVIVEFTEIDAFFAEIGGVDVEAFGFQHQLDGLSVARSSSISKTRMLIPPPRHSDSER
jgi:hypothetical protein